jgi:hypothetical protein
MQRRSVRTQRGDTAPDPSYYSVADGNGQATTQPKQATMWVATQDLQRTV